MLIDYAFHMQQSSMIWFDFSVLTVVGYLLIWIQLRVGSVF